MKPETIHERVAALRDMGFRSFSEERYEAAEVAFRMLAIADPDCDDAWIGLGSALAKQDRHQEAAIIFALATVIADPDDGWPSLLAAESFLRCGDSARAADALDWFRDVQRRGVATPEQRAHAGVLAAQIGGR